MSAQHTSWPLLSRQRSSSDAPNYRYEALDLTSGTIRLLRLEQEENATSSLHPAVECRNRNRSTSDLDLKLYKTDLKFYKPKHVSLDREILTCSLHVFKIKKAPRFTALSYTWGDDDLFHDISVDGKRLTIKRNLWTALRTLKIHGAPKEIEDPLEYLWIDAICIDQTNVLERNHQVSIMQEIFSLADHVIAWLGEADKHSSHAIMSLASRAKQWRFAEESREDLSKFEQDLPQPFDFGRSVFVRPYWSRVWIVQEFVLPSNVVMMCGTMTCRWDELEIVSKMIAGPQQRSTQAPIWMLFNLRHEYRKIRQRDVKPRTRFFDMVGLFRDHGCSDPRDKIFGLAGLFVLEENTSDEAAAFVVDYEMSPKQVLLSFLRHTLELFEQVKPPNLEHYIISLAIRMGVQPRSLLDDAIILSLLADGPLTYPEIWRGSMSWKAVNEWLTKH